MVATRRSKKRAAPENKSDKARKKPKNKSETFLDFWTDQTRIDEIRNEVNQRVEAARNAGRDKLGGNSPSEILRDELFENWVNADDRKVNFKLTKSGKLSGAVFVMTNVFKVAMQRHVTKENRFQIIQAVIVALSEMFPDSYLVQMGGMGAIGGMWRKLFDTSVMKTMSKPGIFHGLTNDKDWERNIKRPDGTEITGWDDLKNKPFSAKSEIASKNRANERAVSKQIKPTKVRLDQVESFYNQLMDDVLTKDKKFRPDLKEIEFSERAKYWRLSDSMHKLGFLLQATIGSRYKGLVLNNVIADIPFEMTLEHLGPRGKSESTKSKILHDDDLDTPEDEVQAAIQSWYDLKTQHNENLVVVSGLSKQRGTESKAVKKRILKDKGYAVDSDDNDLDPTIVKPVIGIYLSSTEFVKLFTQYRRAVFYCLFKRLNGCCDKNQHQFKQEKERFQKKYGKLMKLAKEAPVPKTGKLPLKWKIPESFRLIPDESLTGSYVSGQFYKQQQGVAKALLKSIFEKLKMDNIRQNTKGMHVLRKLYTVWSYQLYARRDVKEIAYSQAVLGHRSMGVSMRYTDTIIDNPLVSDRDKDVTVWLAVHLARLEKQSKQLTDMQEKLDSQLLDTHTDMFSIPRLQIKRHTPEQVKKNEDVQRVLDAIESWIKNGKLSRDTPLTQKVMSQMGIGTGLRQRVRQTTQFKKLVVDLKNSKM